jgi:hypothetical protein
MGTTYQRRWWLIVVGLLAIALAWWSFRADDDAGFEREQSPLSGGRGEVGLARDGAKRAPGERGVATGSLALYVRDMDGQPVAGLEIGVGSSEGMTDRLGELMLIGLEPGRYSVRLPEGWLVHSFEPEVPREIEVELGTQREELSVARDCTGPFEVFWPSGEPMEGAVLKAGFGEAVVDARGRTPPVARRCGLNSLWFWHGDSFAYIQVPVEVLGPELVRVPLPPDQDATVVVVDPDGRPIEAKITGIHLSEAIELEPGVYRVEAPVDVLNCSVTAAGLERRRVHIPLDGGRYTVDLNAHREVTVHADCDGECPEKIRCGQERCEREGDDYSCICRSEDATLSAQGMPCDTVFPSLEVPVGVDEIDWDLRCGESSVVGRWMGRTPCTVSVSGRGYKLGQCRDDGRFEVTELWPGAYTLVVTDQDSGRSRTAVNASQQVSRRLEVAEDQRFDLGTLGPDSGCIEGVLDCDEPLDDLVLNAEGRAVDTRLGDDGHFLLCNLPMDEDVTLRVRSIHLGEATTTARAGDYLTWRVSWGLDGGETVSLRRDPGE